VQKDFFRHQRTDLISGQMAAPVSYEPSFFLRLKQKLSLLLCSKKPDNIKAIEALPADSKARQVQDLREFFRELGIYLLMLFCFSLAIWLDSSSIQQHNLARVFKDVIKPGEAPSSINAFYELLYSYQNSSDSCSGILCSLTSIDYFAGDSAANQTSGSSTFLGSTLLGQMRLRQIRVQKAPCSSFFQKLEAIDCYPEYAAGQEETTYTKDWAPDFDTSMDAGFQYQSQADTGEVSHRLECMFGCAPRCLRCRSSCIRLWASLQPTQASVVRKIFCMSLATSNQRVHSVYYQRSLIAC
jgi:hypothetical protein